MSFRKWLVGGVRTLSILIGLSCIAMTAVSSIVLAIGGILSWLFPSISFEIASVIAGQITLVTAVFFLLVVYAISNAPPQVQSPDKSEDENDDDDFNEDLDIEALAERVKELALAKLSQSIPAEPRYRQSRPRRK